ncbi:AAA family ATPase [Photobacterium nomapromontoriensis]|uniref:AAA family ATPase n=1 Tax=Photobacterium nomapromontoriensis TaxID=2910237 RepID=UPI003D0D3986
MGTDTHLHALELESQIQLLSRLQFLTRFSSNLIQITGVEGAGKTWLSQRYLERWAGSGQQALLLCHPNQSDSQHRAFILQQLAPRAVFNEQDPIQQSIERMLGSYSVNALIVVDDAHLLSPIVLAELWALVQHARNTSGWQINVLLFSHTGRLDKFLRQIAHGQGAAPLELEISELTEHEAQTFIEKRVMDKPLDAKARRWIREQAIDCTPLPGALVKLECGEHKDMADNISRRPASVMVLAILVVLIIGAIAWWFIPLTSNPLNNEREMSTALNDSAVPDTQTLVEQAIGDVSQAVDDPNESETLLTTDTAQDDSHSLPPEVSLEGLTVGRSDDNPRVVVPSTVVDAMIDEQELGGTGEQAVAQQIGEPEGIAEAHSATASEPAMLVVDDGDDVAAPSVTPVTPESTAVNKIVEAALSPMPEPEQATTSTVELGAGLREIPAQHYALQLAAMKSLTAANEFIDEYQIATHATVYQTRRNGEPWFIIVTGNYKNVLAARKAEPRLPARLQALQPWVKSYQQIHREMNRAK